MSRCRKGCLGVLLAALLGFGCGRSPTAPYKENKTTPAERVRAARPEERVAIAIAEVTAAAKGSNLAEVLKSVVEVAPEASSGCARAAVTAEPTRAGQWVTVAVQAAPNYAPQVVKESCQAAPDQFAAIACAAGRVAPLRSHSIVLALSDALPDLRDHLERAKTLVGEHRSQHPGVPVLIQQTLELIEADHAAETSQKKGQP